MDIGDITKSVSGSGMNIGDLLGSALGLLQGQQGGLDGLLGLFASKGLGDIVGSWIGTGSNLPVSPSQITSVFGEDTIKNMATKNGTDTNTFTSKLSELFPNVIDKLTPNGKVTGSETSGLNIETLASLFGIK
jgi:uncharacterized protein YidB (DUF937 family)